MDQVGTEFSIDWAVAVRNEVTVRKKIRKCFCGIRYWGWHEKKFPKRVFDTRAGDVIPAKFQELKRQMTVDVGLEKVYFYPGEEEEIPTFEHVARQRSLTSRKTLMAMLELNDGVFYEIAVDRLRVSYDASLKTPFVHLVVFQEFGFMTYSGHQPVLSTITFRDKAQQQDMIVELYDKELIKKAA